MATTVHLVVLEDNWLRALAMTDLAHCNSALIKATNLVLFIAYCHFEGMLHLSAPSSVCYEILTLAFFCECLCTKLYLNLVVHKSFTSSFWLVCFLTM